MRLSGKFRRFDLVIFATALVLVAYFVLMAGKGFPLDDSWIHQTYARNLAQNGEWAFVAGQPSAASTSPLYTVVLSIGYLLNIPYALWTHVVGGLSLVICAMLCLRMAEWQLPKMRFAGAISAMFILATWHLIWAAASGMETMLFAMLTIALIYLAWREHFVESSAPVGLRGANFGVISGFTVLARPEGILLVGIIGLVMLIVQPQGSFRRVFSYGLTSIIAFAFTLSPYLLLNLQLTGGLLPNTATAKFQQHAVLLQLPYLTRVKNMIVPLLPGGQLLLIPGIFGFVWMSSKNSTHRRVRLFLIPVIWAGALILLYAARLPADYQHGRYVIPALPSLVLMGVIGTLYLLDRAKYQMLPRVLTRVLFASAVLAQIAFALVIAPPIYRTDVAIINEEMVATAHWIEANIPRGELLAIHDIGAVGYFSPRPMLDIAGLVSPDVAPIVDDAEALWALMQARDARFLMAFPDQIPGGRAVDPRLCPLFTTNGETARRVSGPNMAVYRLAWDGDCGGE